MQELKIEYTPIDKIRSYEKNAKTHTKEQIRQIARSIQEFGMNDPIALDKDNTIIEGHGRLLAIKYLKDRGLYPEETVPTLHLDHLTDQQRKAYILVHNQLTMSTGFDLDILQEEIRDIADIDMGDFGFIDIETQALERELKHEQNRLEYADLKSNIHNLQKAQYPGVPPYDIPEILPTKRPPRIDQWIGFNEVLTDSEPAHKAVHFFVDDYQFERLWNRPDDYIEKLRKYAAVASPDFSTYGDMPHIAQIWNHYRKHWLARYWQEQGITVIPTIRRSDDPRSREWFLHGEPQDSAVIVSSMYKDKTDEDRRLTAEFWDDIKTQLHPSLVFIYGEPVQGWDGIKTIYIPTFARTRSYNKEKRSCQE